MVLDEVKESSNFIKVLKMQKEDKVHQPLTNEGWKAKEDKGGI